MDKGFPFLNFLLLKCITLVGGQVYTEQKKLKGGKKDFAFVTGIMQRNSLLRLSTVVQKFRFCLIFKFGVFIEFEIKIRFFWPKETS